MESRIKLVIPTYNNPETIVEVIGGCLKECELSILVLDDGSDISVSSLIEASENNFIKEAKKSGHLEIKRFNENIGKGGVLRWAIKDLTKRSFTHMLTFDADAQHLPEEIKKLTKSICTDPWALVIGSRNFSGENVPESSKFGRKFSNFWVQYQTGSPVLDSQSGLRAYPLFFLQNMNFFTTRYDFEIEVLIRLLWKNVTVNEVQVEVYYPKKEERVSHFDKFKDNFRLSVLNTVLVTLSLLKTHTSKNKVALALAVGAFVGLTPLFGLHTFIAILLCLVFRLNFPIVWVGTNISIPPLIPLWVGTSVYIGSKVLGKDIVFSPDKINFEHAKDHLLVWGSGSLILALSMSILIYFIANVVGKRFSKKNVPWSGKRRGGTFGNFILGIFIKKCGPKFVYSFLYFITPYFYLFAPKARKALNEYWEKVSPESSWIQRQFKINKLFIEHGKIAMDRVYLSFGNRDKFKFSSKGPKNIFDTMEKERGLILLGAHIGAWDISTEGIVRYGKLDEINIVQYDGGKASSPESRQKLGPVRFISANGKVPAIFKINDALERKKAVAFMGDRAYSRKVELVSFFDGLVPIEISPFKISVLRDVPLVMFAGIRNGPLDYSFQALKPIWKDESKEGRDGKIIDVCQKFAKNLENLVKENPYQWCNFYAYWSSLPLSFYQENGVDKS